MKNIIRIALIVLVILLIPLFGNMFIEGWNWSFTDFIIMGALLFVTGLAIDYSVRHITKPLYRTIAIVAIVLALLVVWVELATGGVSRAFLPHENAPAPQSGKLDINAVCESALAYTSFPDGASADAFVKDCKEGRHPEVIEAYKAQMNVGSGAEI